MFDARKVFDLNDAIPASDPALFRGNPIVAFPPKVWKGEEIFSTFRRGESNFPQPIGMERNVQRGGRLSPTPAVLNPEEGQAK